ncbi:MAG: peptide synthetase [Oscillospiraceae bacterium]|nr:peptide synthetase [Oscillospiraceae bacterium]
MNKKKTTKTDGKETDKKIYPLTTSQKLMLYTYQVCSKKEVLNIGTFLEIKYDIDKDVLAKAISKACERNESTRIRFVKGEKEGEIGQYIAAKSRKKAEYYDFSQRSREDIDRDLHAWTSTPFKLYNTPMNRIVMLSMPEGFFGIYLLVSHLTMDAQALILFLRDVIEIYCSMMYEEVEFPKETASYIEQLEKDLAYEAGNAASARDEKFFDELIKESEPIFCAAEGISKIRAERAKYGAQTRAVTNVSSDMSAAIKVFSLEKEPSDKLMKFCEDYKVSMAALLMMGLRTYFQKFNYVDDVSVQMAIARRATLKEKRSGGTRIHPFPCRTIIGRDKSFLEGLEIMKEKQSQLFRHANYNPVKFLDDRAKYYNLKPGQAYEPMSLTYQPLTLKDDNSLSLISDIEYRTRWYSNGAAAQILYLTVMHRPFDNGLDFNFEYQPSGISEEKLEYLYYYVCRILFEALKDPERPIGEILDNV